MSVNIFILYKKKLETFCEQNGVIPLANLSDIIA